MKALALRQPWAYAVTHLGKRIENRTWAYPPAMRGERIAIHAGARSGLDADGVEFLASLGHQIDVEGMPYGAVVLTAKLGYVLKERPDGPLAVWWCGPLAWRLRDVIVLPTPVPCRGRQKLWELPEDVLERVMEGEAKALDAAGRLA